MKKHLLSFGFAIIILPAVQAQVQYQFTFDDSGNRIKREVVSLVDPGEGPAEPELMTFIENPEIVEEKSPESSEPAFDELEISVYPNPVRDQVTLHIPALEEEDKGEVTVFGMNGGFHYSNSTLETNTIVNMSGKAPGNYILRLVLNGERKEWVIIKD